MALYNVIEQQKKAIAESFFGLGSFRLDPGYFGRVGAKVLSDAVAYKFLASMVANANSPYLSRKLVSVLGIYARTDWLDYYELKSMTMEELGNKEVVGLFSDLEAEKTNAEEVGAIAAQSMSDFTIVRVVSKMVNEARSPNLARNLITAFQS